jgi:hypothetical protein
MGITDYYFLLGLPRFAPLDEVKAAYRKLAAQYHPDKVAELGPEAEEEATAKMQELNEAMAVLSDPARRQQYHQLLDLIPERPLSPPPKPKPKLPPRPVTPSVEAVPEPSQPQPPPPEPEVKRDLLVEEQLRGIRDAVRKTPLKWKEKKLRGWQWALEHSEMRRCILVVHRHFENLSRLSIRTVVNAVNELADARKLALNPTAVIALISYERLMDARDVQSQLRALAGPRGWFKNVRPVVVLRDGKTQRTTLFGSPGEDPEAKRVVQLLAGT